MEEKNEDELERVFPFFLESMKAKPLPMPYEATRVHVAFQVPHNVRPSGKYAKQALFQLQNQERVPVRPKYPVAILPDLNFGESSKEQGKKRRIAEVQAEEAEANADAEVEEVEIVIKPPKRKKARLNEKDIWFGNEEDIALAKQRDKDKDTNLKTMIPAYYMNNRERFVSFINEMFRKYREVESELASSKMDCKNIGKAGATGLLMHQQLVTDYLNLYSPYRGLLLYHGLGSGKTCSSIAVAEGVKTAHKIIILTPASLKDSYIREIRKCGDPLFRKGVSWKWVDADRSESEALAKAIGLPVSFVDKHKGAFVAGPQGPQGMAGNATIKVEDQINEMIMHKYRFINYNGVNLTNIKMFTDNFTHNIFDNATVIVDEAHNLVSRIVNKLSAFHKKKTNKNNKKTVLETPMQIAKKHFKSSAPMAFYYLLLTAQNAKVVFLSGTPIINYPNEVGIMFNMLRGVITTWQLKLGTSSSKQITKTALQRMNLGTHVDFLDYSSGTRILTITRNPNGFENRYVDREYTGVSREVRHISDAAFLKQIKDKLDQQGIQVEETKRMDNVALPDSEEEFNEFFAEPNDLEFQLENSMKLKRRILGLTSYFKSVQDGLMPQYNPLQDLHVVRVEMSDLQFETYETYRVDERKSESVAKKQSDMFDKTSTYCIFSRFACNFVMPDPPGRPLINKEAKKMEEMAKAQRKALLDEDEDEVKEAVAEVKMTKSAKALAKAEEKVAKALAKAEEKAAKAQAKAEEKAAKAQAKAEAKKNKRGGASDSDSEDESEEVFVDDEDNDDEAKESDNEDSDSDVDLDLEPVPKAKGKKGTSEYDMRLDAAFQILASHKYQYLSLEGLTTYSPKFKRMIENITDEDHPGLHLVYSQFRTMEGIGIFSLALEANGFIAFEVQRTSLGWELVNWDVNNLKPRYALYTGTEDAEAKKIIINVYNGLWDDVPKTISDKLRRTYSNNNMGEVIKVFMITASGSEGINLKNTRYVHIMEPYWNSVRTEQVIGRARRICSHTDLPKELQTVEVFIYISVLTAKQLASNEANELKINDRSKKTGEPQTTDERLLEISERKARMASQLLKAIKESAIDCATYSKNSTKEGLTCVSFKNPGPNDFVYQPNYAEEPDDTMEVANKQTVRWVAKPILVHGVQYALRPDTKPMEVYDYESVLTENPLLVGYLEKVGEDEYDIRRV